MTPEDEEFERISREIRRNAAEDDDIQDYKKPWVGLTPDELNMISNSMKTWNSFSITDVYFAIEKKLKEKNFWTLFTKTLWKPTTHIFGQHQE